MKTHRIVVSWLDSQRKWAATSHDPKGKALADSPTIAVNRLKRSLLQREGPAEFAVTLELPSGARSAANRYLGAMNEAAEKQAVALSLQVELAELFIDRYGLNRTQAAAAVGLSHSYLCKILDGKVLRNVSPQSTTDPAVSIAEFVNTPVAQRQSSARNGKKR